MPLPRHDFSASLALAKDDTDLRAQLLKYFKTDALARPDESDLVNSTMDVVTWVVQQARSLYASEPQRLVAAISLASTGNALAVWSSSRRDWIVVSVGLMELLRDAVDDLGRDFARTFPELMETDLMQRLQSKPPLRGGFETSLGSFLYFSALAFFAGHEAGHHLAGHDGYYVDGAHAEQSAEGNDTADESWPTKQALEREADLIGLKLCRMSMTKLLSQLWEVDHYSVAERRSYQRVLAALLGTGAMTAALRITPREVDWEELPSRVHPPAGIRVLTLAESLSRAIAEGFSDLDDTSRKWIRLMSLELVAGATINPGTDLDRVYQERLARGGEPAAIRATGMRKALHDPRFSDYNARLDAALALIKPRLRPRTVG
jgi:hypothetical protein